MHLIIIVGEQIDPRNTIVIIKIFMTMSPFFVDNFPFSAAQRAGETESQGGQGCWAGRRSAAVWASSDNLCQDADNTETLGEMTEKSVCFYFIEL